MEADREYEISRIEDYTYQEYMDIYKNDILGDSSSSAIHKAFLRYLINVVEPVGWQAIWKKELRSSCIMCDILVEVLDVSQLDLEAEVHCLKILNSDENLEGIAYAAELETLVKNPCIVAPLMELYPTVKQELNLYLQPTVKALELLRFFFSNLARPWDKEFGDDTEVFAQKYLEPRLQLYFDVVNNTVPQKTVKRISSLISDAHSIMKKLNVLRNEMKAEEDEMELNEQDVLACMELTMRLEIIQKEVEMLENPLLRNLMKKQEIQCLSPNQRPRRKIGKVVTHLVGESVTFSMIKDLPMDQNQIIQLHESIVSAVSCCDGGDTILLFPGMYSCEGLGWLEEDVSVQGLKSSKLDTILNATTETVGDIFINSASRRISFENLTIQASHGMISDLIMIHRGTLYLQNVHIQCCSPSYAYSGITLLEDSHLLAKHVSILNVKGNGIDLHRGSKCEMMDCTITTCGNAVNYEHIASTEDKKTSLAIKNSSFFDISNFGIACSTVLDSNADFDVLTEDELRSESLEMTLEGNVIEARLGNYGKVSNCSLNHDTKCDAPIDAVCIKFDPDKDLESSTESCGLKSK